MSMTLAEKMPFFVFIGAIVLLFMISKNQAFDKIKILFMNNLLLVFVVIILILMVIPKKGGIR